MPTGAALVVIGLIVVMSLGLIAYAIKTGTPLRYDDELEYIEIANNLTQGHGFALEGTPTAYRPPAWPIVLAAFLLVGMPASLLSLVSAFSMIAAAVLAAHLGTKITRSPWGGLAGAALLAYPVNIYTAVTLYPQAFASLLVIFLWWSAFRITELHADGKTGAAWYPAMGFASATLALSVPTLAFTGLAAILWVVITSRGRRVRTAFYTFSAFLVPIAAWVVRNTLLLGAPVLLSTSTGLNLLIGNNPTATGSSGTAVDITATLQTASTMTEAKSDAYLRNTALSWIFENPSDSATLYLAKLANYFAPYNEPVTETAGGSVQRYIAYASCAGLVGLVLTRILLRKRLPVGPTERLFLVIFLLNALVMAMFFTRVRFRQPLDNILVIEAAVAVAVVIGLVTARRIDRREARLSDGAEAGRDTTR